MKYLKLFDSYSFKQIFNIDDENIDGIFYWRDHDDKDIFYEFTNKKGIEFLVVFENEHGFDGDGEDRDPKIQFDNCVYTRTYKIKNEKIEKLSNSGDPYDIVDTLSKITIDFINKYNPLRIIIEHIPSQKEIDKHKEEEKKNGRDSGLFSGGFPKSKETIRAKFNKKSLMKYLPNNYVYRLDGVTSLITKKAEDW